MSVVIKHTKEDLNNFRNEVCSKCHCLQSCTDTFENSDNHIQCCPKFFNYVIGYKSFVTEQIEWERDHPEEVELRRQKNLEIAKSIKLNKLKSKHGKKS